VGASARKRRKNKRVADTGRREVDEIVADMIRLAGCRGVKIFKRKDRVVTDRQLIEQLVRRRIEDLRAALPPFTGNETRNAKFAKDLRKQIDTLKRMLTDGPAHTSHIFGDRFWSLWDWQGTAIEINPQTRDYIAQEPPKRFIEELDRIRTRCDLIIGLNVGKHGGIKHQHEHAAIASLEVLKAAASYTGTKPKLGYSLDGRLNRIASLFLEAVTGEYVTDLRRACRAVVTRLRTKTQN